MADVEKVYKKSRHEKMLYKGVTQPEPIKGQMLVPKKSNIECNDLPASISYLAIDYLYRMKILMVCLGNICRSPMAEGILQDKANKAGLGWTVDSAGTLGQNTGCAPHHLSQKVALQNGVDICDQKCRHFTKEDMDRFDKIYVMDEENYKDVKYIAGEKWDATKVDLLLNTVYPGRNRSIPDPWYGGEDGFKKVYKMIDEACEKVVASYVQSTPIL